MTNQPLLGPADPVNITTFTTLTTYLRGLRGVILSMWNGKLNCTGTITLTAGAATTVLNRKGLSPQSVVHFDPKTANAATELYGATMYVLTANRGNDAWTITHANNANADKTFQYTIIG